ncbi:SDR family oxidoreductase [Novacetimonas hansenii]|uniref:SDR family oxidoreductase n=1 Tax=Novacetimonas hansenii TaxID=436 RepID=UPI00094FF69F|nr:SDR family oxidoreductase [Novacetimonas hansenii]
MDLDISGRRALIMGASQGLGLASAQALACEGVDVILTGRSTARLEQARQSVQTTRTQVDIHTVDFSDPTQVETLLGLIPTLGIDIVITNCGGPPAGDISAVDAQVWRAQFETMVNVPIQIAQAALTHMRQQTWGRIINIASSSVVQLIPQLGLSSALRMSVIGWAKALSMEVAADGITVNSVIPGRIHTRRVDQIDRVTAISRGCTPQDVAAASQQAIPMQRYGRADEFADAVAFLASRRASYITGSTLRVDGGLIQTM